MNGLDLIVLAQRLRDAAFTKVAATGFASFGAGSRILLPTRLSGADQIAVGDGVLIGAGSWLMVPERRNPGVVLRIGNRVRMNTTSITAVESVEIEDGVGIARGVYISDHSHGFSRGDIPIRDQPIERVAPVRIGRGSWIGQNAVIMPGVTIGRGCVIGANSVVRHDVPDRTVVAGAPARELRSLRG